MRSPIDSSDTTADFAASPDVNANGFLEKPPDPSRYEYVDEHPAEVAALLAHFIPVGCRVLDVGCGTGSVSSVIKRFRKVELVGVEPDERRAEMARQRGLEVNTGYLNAELGRKLGQFDVVLFADVIEHLPNPSAVLRQARGVLRPGGAVVLSVPNVAHWSVRWSLLCGEFEYASCGIMDATHLRWFTSKSLCSLLARNGFAVQALVHTAGTTLPYYSQAWPWRRIDYRRRSILIRRLATYWPQLFGAQHVARAILAPS